MLKIACHALASFFRYLWPVVFLLAATLGPVQAESFSQRVRCGHDQSYTDSHGYVWQADQAYAQSQNQYKWGYLSGDHPAQFDSYELENTLDWPLYQQERWGNGTQAPAYRVDVPGPGTYYVKLLFSEMYFGVQDSSGTGIGRRIFNVSINGNQVLTHFDIMAETGGRALRAVVKPFKVTVTGEGTYSNTIVIATGSIVENPKINAIEVTAGPSLTDAMDAYTTADPTGGEAFRLNCGGTKSVDSTGKLWMTDEAFASQNRWGYENGTVKTVESTEPDHNRMVTWREGHEQMHYRFNLPNGAYQVRLYFQENTYHQSGQRVFDVAVNGQPVASHLDVFQAAGFQTPYEVQTGLQVNHETLDISFPHVSVGAAMINAIEVDALNVSNEAFLDFVERKSLSYFIPQDNERSGVNPANGLVSDRLHNQFDGYWSNASTAAVGFGLGALAAGMSRGWIPPSAAEEQVTTILRTLAQAAPFTTGQETGLVHKEGFFFHFLDIQTGQRSADSELSSIDSAILLAGVATVRQAFTSASIQQDSATILDRVNWPWFTNQQAQGMVAMHWNPESGFEPWTWDGYNEGALIYLMGTGASHPVSPAAWWHQAQVWRQEFNQVYMTDKQDAPPLFRQIYPQSFIDLRQSSDAKNDYFLNSQQAAAANRLFCQANSSHPTYAQGGWGLTSGDGPVPGAPGSTFSYREYKPQAGSNDGTVNPSIVAAAIPFYPEQSIATLRKMYFQYKHFLWGRFGFADGYNLDAPQSLDAQARSGQGWVGPDVIGIDLGSMVMGIENYRTGFIWASTNAYAPITEAKQQMGFNKSLIDNFDQDARLNDTPDQRDGQWWSPSPQTYAMTTENYIAGNTSPLLRIDFNKGAGSEWDYVVLGDLTNPANLSYVMGYDQFRFRAHGQTTVLLKFRDRYGKESPDSGILTINAPDSWQTVTWDLQHIDWGECNPREIKDILFFIKPGQTGQGTLQLDDIEMDKTNAATPTPSPTPTMTRTATPTPTATPSCTPGGLKYNTFFGGSGKDTINDMLMQGDKLYVVGETTSTDLPITSNALDKHNNGTEPNRVDGFLAIFRDNGQTLDLQYCTYLGGSSQDSIMGIKLDHQGNIYLTGATWSPDFPVTAGAYNTTIHGAYSPRDAYLAKLDPTGSRLLYSTFLGGPNWDYGFCLDMEEPDVVYIGGFTHGSFPVTAGAAQTQFGGYGDGFVTKFDIGANRPVYSTYVGGNWWEPVAFLAVKQGKVYLANGTQSTNFPMAGNYWDDVNNVPYPNSGGGDATFAVLSADGSHFEFSTYLGPENDHLDTAFTGLAIDDDGTIYATGYTYEPDFPMINTPGQASFAGVKDGILVKIVPGADNATYTIAYTRFLGGDGEDQCKAIALGNDHDLWIYGTTKSANFPEAGHSVNDSDLFVLNLTREGQIRWGKRIGGSADESGSHQHLGISFNQRGDLILGGNTASSDYPVSSQAFQKIYGGGALDGVIASIGDLNLLTATPTPGVNTDPVIDNFDNDHSLDNAMNENDSEWQQANGPITAALVENVKGNNTSLLKVDYNKPNDDWSSLENKMYLERGDQTNFSTTTKISMRVLGTVDLLLKFKDFNDQQSGDIQTISVQNPDTWRVITFDYSAVNWLSCNASQIRSLVLIPQPGRRGSGSFYLDDLRLGDYQVAANLIDDFENDGQPGDEPGRRDAQWSGSGSNIFAFTTTGTVPNSDGNCLMVTYNKPESEIWANITAGNLMASGNLHDFSVDTKLAMNIKGQVTFRMKFIDINNQPSGELDFTSTEASLWETKVIDYSTLNWGACDKTKVNQIMFFPQAGLAGSGTFYIDNISLGTGVVQAAAARMSANSTIPGKLSGQLAGVVPTVTPVNDATPTATVTPTMDYSKLWKGDKVLVYPNPARDTVKFLFEMNETGRVQIYVYKITGDLVARIEKDQSGGSGQTGEARWDARQVAPGIYLARIVVENDHGDIMINKIKKIAIIK